MADRTDLPLKIGGGFGSPYSLKMRAVLRYRHIPFQWIPRDSEWDDLAPVKVKIMPTFGFPNADGVYDESMVDSTPIIDRLEVSYPERSLVPTDAVVAFLDYLIEDFGDEWMTKMMYHYRWHYPEAVDKAGRLLPLDHNLQMSDEVWRGGVKYITDRQVSRMALVGSTPENTPVVEASYRRTLHLMDAIISQRNFLLGNRPGRGDFAAYGQLSQLVLWDPESTRIAIAEAPRVVTWTMRMDDPSWIPVTHNEGWLTRDLVDAPLLDLLKEMGHIYAPFLLANAEAHHKGEETFSIELDRRRYSQGTFVYQVKCLKWLREKYAALNDRDRADLDAILQGTGCERLFS